MRFDKETLRCSFQHNKPVQLLDLDSFREHLINHFYEMSKDQDIIRNILFEILHNDCEGDQDKLKNRNTLFLTCNYCGWEDIARPIDIELNAYSHTGLAFVYEEHILDCCTKCKQWREENTIQEAIAHENA